MLTRLSFAKCYIDDIIIFNSTSKDHMHHMQEVFGRFKDHNLKFYLDKCQFFQTQVEYLGHMIYPGELGVQKAKVESISQVPQPTNVNQLRTFLGLCKYYRRFVKGFNNIAKPLTRLTHINDEYVWGEEQEHAFQELKAQLSLTPILKRPIRRRLFQLHIDQSTLKMGAMFIQLDDDGQEFVVVYVSWSNNKTQAKYISYEGSYEGECLVVWVVYSFWCYLYGSPFTLVIDHQPLKFLMESNQFTSKLVKWVLILHEYNFDIVHTIGKAN